MQNKSACFSDEYVSNVCLKHVMRSCINCTINKQYTRSKSLYCPLKRTSIKMTLVTSTNNNNNNMFNGQNAANCRNITTTTTARATNRQTTIPYTNCNSIIRRPPPALSSIATTALASSPSPSPSPTSISISSPYLHTVYSKKHMGRRKRSETSSSSTNDGINSCLSILLIVSLLKPLNVWYHFIKSVILASLKKSTSATPTPTTTSTTDRLNNNKFSLFATKPSSKKSTIMTSASSYSSSFAARSRCQRVLPPIRTTSFITLLTIICLETILLSTMSSCAKTFYMHWNTSNSIFRIDNTDHIIDVNKGNLAFEFDQVHIICPVYEPGTYENETEKYIIYNVSKVEYETCRITNADPRVIAICDKPQKLMFFTITFRPFTPQPGGLEFLPGNDYYFISTSSKDDLYRRIGGRCSTDNMKVVFKVCCVSEEKNKTTTAVSGQGGSSGNENSVSTAVGAGSQAPTDTTGGHGGAMGGGSGSMSGEDINLSNSNINRNQQFSNHPHHLNNINTIGINGINTGMLPNSVMNTGQGGVGSSNNYGLQMNPMLNSPNGGATSINTNIDQFNRIPMQPNSINVLNNNIGGGLGLGSHGGSGIMLTPNGHNGITMISTGGGGVGPPGMPGIHQYHGQTGIRINNVPSTHHTYLKNLNNNNNNNHNNNDHHDHQHYDKHPNEVVKNEELTYNSGASSSTLHTPMLFFSRQFLRHIGIVLKAVKTRSKLYYSSLLNYDPKVVEQKEQAQPACLPLSYVLRFISDDARKESPFLTANAAGAELKRKLAIKHHSYSMSSSNRSNTPTGSEMDEDEMVVSESEDSNDSWTTEEFSSEFIMRYGSRHSGSGSNGTPGNEKPFACPVPGCKKRYKNVNGIKYHSKNGHKKDGKVRKGYKCHCGKSYKTAQGLKSHALVAHNSSPENVLVSQALGGVLSSNGSGVLMQRSSSPSQSLGSLSPSSISNMSSGASSCHGSAGGITGNNGGSQNLLPHFSNGNHTSNGPNAINCLAQVINGAAGPLNIQQQQQQIFNTTANNQSLVVSAPVSSTLSGNVATTVTPIANSQTSAESSTSFSFSGQLLATAMQQQRCISSTAGVSNVGFGSSGGKCLYAATAPLMQQTSLLPYNGTAGNGSSLFSQQQQLPAISPTFIEHKYSANTFKEKFFANLRQNQQNVTNKLKSLNSTTIVDNSKKSSINDDTSIVKAPLETDEKGIDDNRSSGMDSSVGCASTSVFTTIGCENNTNEKCSIQQQLNDTMKNNLYKKSIN